MKIAKACVDVNELCVTNTGDGGDSLANAATFDLLQTFGKMKGLDMPTPAPEILDWSKSKPLYTTAPGIWRRHPDPTQWYSNPDTTSRDQILPAMLAMGLRKDYHSLWKTQWNIIKRVIPVFPWIPILWAQNIYNNGSDGVAKGKKLPDTFLGHLHLFIRAWGWWATPLYPVLIVWDLLLLLAAVINVYGAQDKDPQNCDDRNGINCHIAAIYALPTPLSYLARKIYSKYRPYTYAGRADLPWLAEKGQPIETNRVQSAVTLYFWETQPIIAESFRPIITKYFS